MLAEKIQEHAISLFGQSFKFRDGQVEAIQSIVENAISDTKHTVLEAPTGSGKSIIALLSAYVLFKEFEKKSYILVSDLSLFDQYANDICKLDSKVFGKLKGKENYICYVNGCKVSQSKCSLQGLSINGSLYNAKKTLGCTYQCEYANEYSRAVKAPITLMTYQLYFIQRNYVEDDIFGGKNPNFPKRDLVICDECHKICDICQSHFAPRISIEHPHWMNVLDRYAHMYPSENERMSILGKIELNADNDELIDAISDYGNYIGKYCDANNKIRRNLAKKDNLSKNEREALIAGNLARQEHCKIVDMVAFVKQTGSSKHIVKTTLGNEITINFVFDSLMLKKYLHDKSACELLMSATIGDVKEYSKLAGLDENSTKSLMMKSSFDFSNSPIYVSADNCMSAADKSTSIKNIAKQVANICHLHQNSRGIIQTGSYSNSEDLKMLLPLDVVKRCILYSNTIEKKNALEKYLATKDAILVGPTLVEGLNFPDDLCRFQICIKVPYAYLGSEYVKKKKDYIDGWYVYDATTKICQGIGRGVRHKDDWCKTYILDGCIMNIYNKLENIDVLDGRFKLFEEEQDDI